MLGKVLFISHDATRTGAPIVLLYLLKWLRQNTNIQMHVLLKDGGPLEDEFRAIGPTQLLNWSNSCFDRVSKEVLLKEFASQDFSLIYSNTIANGELLEYLAPSHCPILTHVHELEYRIRHQTRPEVFAGVTAFTDHYLAASEAVRKNLVDNHGIPEHVIDVIHEFIPTNARQPDTLAKCETRRRMAIPPEALVVGACGTSDWRKGPDLFIQLAVMVRRRMGNRAHFCWLGAQTESRDFTALQYDVEKANLLGCVHFVEPQPNPWDYFSLFDVFVSMSREDPFPLVNLEAASYGVPIICFDGSGGAKELVQDDCGYVAGYLDLEEMCARVAELLNAPALRLRLGQRAQEKVTRDHDVAVAAPQVLDLIKAVAAAWTSSAHEIHLRRRAQLARLQRSTEASGVELRELFTLLSDPSLSDEVLRWARQALGNRLQNLGFFHDLYNLASWLDIKGEKQKALVLFKALAGSSPNSSAELAGKAHFKIASSAGSDEEAVEHYRRCLELYPAHRAARQQLQKLLQGKDSSEGKK